MHNQDMLSTCFYDRDTQIVARELLGKIIYARYKTLWLSAQIIETEAYYLEDKASHASLGYTEKRKALFMPAGTIYMYYARGCPSLNISTKGEGNAVLIKSGIPYDTNPIIAETMRSLNPIKGSKKIRKLDRLCSGQTLLCKSLSLTVEKWDKQQFDPDAFYIANKNYLPKKILQTKRLGIPSGRDEDLPYRFIDANYLKQTTDFGRSIVTT